MEKLLNITVEPIARKMVTHLRADNYPSLRGKLQKLKAIGKASKNLENAYNLLQTKTTYKRRKEKDAS